MPNFPKMPSLPTKMPERMQSIASDMGLPSPSALLKQFKSLMDVDEKQTQPAGAASKRGMASASPGGSSRELESEGEDGNELVDVSWMHLRRNTPPESGYIDERDYPGVPYQKVNEVALRLEEIARTMEQIEYDKKHPGERQLQLRSELEAGAAARSKLVSNVVCSCAEICDCGQDNFDNASTTLSNMETEPDVSEMYDNQIGGGPRASHTHLVQPSDTVGGICIKYGCTGHQLMQANKAFSQQSLLARREIKIPSAIPQMEPEKTW